MDGLQLFLIIAMVIIMFTGLLAIAGLALYLFLSFFLTINPELPKRWKEQREYRKRLEESRKQEEE